MKKVFHFWQPAVNLHESGWISELSQRGYEVNVYIDRASRSDDFRGQGCNYGSANVLYISNKELPSHLDVFELAKIGNIHIFTGVKEFALNKHYFDRLVKIRSGAKILYLSESKDTRGWRGALRFLRDKIVDRNRLKHVDAFLCMGKKGVDWFSSLGVSSDRLFEFLYCVPADFAGQPIGPLDSASCVKFSFVGQLIKRKNPEILLEAASILREEGARFRLDIYGAGERFVFLKNRIKDLKLEPYVNLIGAVNNGVIRSKLLGEDVLILPSLWDGWGAVVNEALLSGSSVIVSDSCGAASLAPSFKNISVFRRGSLADLVFAMRLAISNGPISNANREINRRCAISLIGPIAVTDYLLSVIDALDHKSDPRPALPWANRYSVALSYHFFPHYRSAIFERLMLDSRFNINFLADEKSDSIDRSIKVWSPKLSLNFSVLPVVRVCGRFYFQPGLCSAIFGLKPDCVVLLADINNISIWLVAVLCRVLGVRVLFWTHGWIDSREHGLRALLRYTFLSIASGLLLYGRRAKKILIDKGYPPDRIWVIYNSLNYSLQSECRERFGGCGDEVRQRIFGAPSIPVVGCISRLGAVRRIDLIIDALKVLGNRGKKVALLLIGDGQERSALEAHAKNCGILLYCAGELYDETQIAPLIMSTCLTVAPGKVGLTAMHSLAYGIPVITTRDSDVQMPESEAIIDGVTGGFFDHGSVEDIASTIDKWTSSVNVDSVVRRSCISVIEKFYNSHRQVDIFFDAVANKSSLESYFPIELKEFHNEIS